MAGKERVYRVTATGRQAWESQDTAMPADYRRILWLIDFHGHGDVLGGVLRSYPKKLLDDWLAELHELGLIEFVPEGQENQLGFASDADRTLKLGDMDRRRLQQDTELAGASLARTGAYLAADRLNERPTAQKVPADTVILIVEDDPDQLALADLRVTMAGYRVRVANSVNALLQALLDEGAPDLLLLDVMLPDGDGFEVLAKMRRHPTLGSLPIVMLTARSEPADIGKGLILGADGYVTKPYTKNILADVIRRVLKQAGDS